MRITERRLTAVLASLLAVCVIAAASTAFLLGRRAAAADRLGDPATPVAASSAAASSAPSTAVSNSSEPSTPAPSTPGTTESATPTAGSSEPASSAPSSPPTSPASTPVTDGSTLDPPVALSAQAAGHPDAAAIQQLVSQNFKSINTLDYQLWVDTVTPEQSAAFGPDPWREAYRTSKDSGITITAIEPDTRWITVTFTSSQSVDKAPADTPSTCLNWKIVSPVVAVSGKLRLAKSIQGLSTHRRCG